MLQRPALPVIVLLVAVVALLALMPQTAQFSGPYAVKFATRIIALAIFVVSLDLLIGIAGLVSFGHAAFFGLGAYAVWFVTPKDDSANVLVAFGTAVLLAGAAAAFIGAFVVRARGFYFIMVTLAASQMLYALFHDTGLAGGSDGASFNIKPDLVIAGATIIDLNRRLTLFYVALVALVLAYLLALWLVRGPFGRVLQTIRWNETRAQALGFDTYAFKLAAFTIAGMMAGFAGALFASIDGFVPPELLNWRQSGLAIMMVVLGGTGSLYGAIIGAVLYNLLEDILKSAGLVGPLVSEHWQIALGVILIAAVLSAPRGIAGWLPVRRPASLVIAGRGGPLRTDPPPLLAVHELSKYFGGLRAVDNVSLEFTPNRIHAIIGPNGAGKTTFINVLSGAHRPNAGVIRLGDRDITRLPVHAKARLGLGRSFQHTNVVGHFTVAENCIIAAQARHPSLLRFSHRGEDETAAVAFALDATGLADKAGQRAAELSHGEQRQLEIAMLIASGARILVLDEPLAGTGPEETARVTALLRALSSNHTIILIEHDMDAVFAVADTISVLVGGRLMAHGTPAEIRNDAQVREAYLGDYKGAA
jgi:branched-chain amino acid transport system permease protein